MPERIVFLLLTVLAGSGVESTSFLPHENFGFNRTGRNDWPEMPSSFWPVMSANYFHVSMLSISLLVGLAYCGYVFYNYWYKNKLLLSFFGSLVIALLLRTLSTLLTESVVIIGGSQDVNGINFLIVLENFTEFCALSYWLLVTIYFHECVEIDFNSEPNLKFFHYAVPGIATYFTLTWTFIMAGQTINANWIYVLVLAPGYEWILQTLYIMYMLIQLGLTLNIGRVIQAKKSTYDNECLSLLKKSGIVMVALVIWKWMIFGFEVGTPPTTSVEVYLYFWFIADGLECAVACPLLFFLEKWVEIGCRQRVPDRREELCVNCRPISTLESVYTSRVSRRIEPDVARDVVYSSVLPPDRLQTMFDLYKRLNLLPVAEVTALAEEVFYECREDAATVYEDVNSRSSAPGGETPPLEANKSAENVKKRNAFYSSRYLLVTQKESKFPDYLETSPPPRPSRPSEINSNRKGGDKIQRQQVSDYAVARWLNDNSENMGKI